MMIAAAMLAVLSVRTPLHAQDSGELESAIKAAYLVKLPPFVGWPALPLQAFTICVVGRNPFGNLVQRAAAGQTIEGRPVQVQALETVTGPSGCQVMYVGGSDAQPVSTVLQLVRGSPVLTVTDGERDAAAQGIINFVIVEGHVRFAIDDAAAAVNGLTISSKLLGIAVSVRPRIVR